MILVIILSPESAKTKAQRLKPLGFVLVYARVIRLYDACVRHRTVTPVVLFAFDSVTVSEETSPVNDIVEASVPSGVIPGVAFLPQNTIAAHCCAVLLFVTIIRNRTAAENRRVRVVDVMP